MPRRKKAVEAPPLATRWSPPDSLAGQKDGAGAPLVCVATTYTFHASLFENDLLPRFLGLKFDQTENERSYVVEREDRLAEVYAFALVDAAQVHDAQTTLRWDQLPVVVPGGCQHAKLTVLLWERCLRVIVSSANLTRQGYRLNREVAGVLDFYDHPDSAPRELAESALEIMGRLVGLTRCAEPARERLREALNLVRARLDAWDSIPPSFTNRDWPRAYFAATFPAASGQAPRSALEEALEHWRGKAEEVVVMTPFVGDSAQPSRTVATRLAEVVGKRSQTEANLALPGRPRVDGADRLLIPIPHAFFRTWTEAWGLDPEDVSVYVVPPRRDGEKNVLRDLHAKALYLAGPRRNLLMIGSSNFSPHGMGVGVHNVEANLVYLDQAGKKGAPLHESLPVDWEADLPELTPEWAEEADPHNEDAETDSERSPGIYAWIGSATLDQRSQTITVQFVPGASRPAAWSLSLPGLDAPLAQAASAEADELELVCSLPGGAVAFTFLEVAWSEENEPQTACFPLQVVSPEHLLPPEDLRGINSEQIVAWILAGYSPAGLIDSGQLEPILSSRAGASQVDATIDPLRFVDTSDYALYRVRRLGRAMGKLREAIARTVRTLPAVRYRLFLHPFGPLGLALAIHGEWLAGVEASRSTEERRGEVAFELGELALSVAHTAQGLRHSNGGEAELEVAPLFTELLERLDELLADVVPPDAKLPENLANYLSEARAEAGRLVKATAHAR